MAEINIAKQLLAARHEKKITQEELASYVGVSKAAVSKWESGVSFPDITLLPKLATYFNVSIDELIGYEPQLTREQIKELYCQLKNIFANEKFEVAMAECRELEKKYYSCFPFLLQMAILYLNHATLSDVPAHIYEHCIELIDEFIEQTQYKERLIQLLAMRWPDMWNDIVQNISITYERKIFYLQLLIDNVDTKRLFELNDNNKMSGFIEENPDILQQLSSIQLEERIP